jgi:hypothetical protein
VFPLVLFPLETVGRLAFYVYDAQCYFYPYRTVAADLVLSGQLPLWNPYANGGMPLIGDGQVGLFYPPNWLFLILPGAHSLTLSILSTYAIAGVGIFVYLRHAGFARWIATVAAVSFMFSGFFVTHLVHVSIPATAAFVPWLFWAFERLIERRSFARLVLGAGLVALQVFAGHPQVPVYTGAALGLYAVVIAIARRGRDFATPFMNLGGMYSLGSLLGAIQLVPWAELSRYSPRIDRTSYELFTGNAITAPDWLLFLFPYGYGGLRTSWMQSIPDVPFERTLQMWERCGYVGLITLALAIVGLLAWRSASNADALPRRGAMLLILTLTLLLAAGASTPAGHVFHAIPLVGQLRAPARSLALCAFALNVMAAYGLRHLTARRENRVDLSALLVGIALPAAVGGLLLYANLASLDGFQERARFFLGTGLKIAHANAWIPLALAVIAGALLTIRSIWIARLLGALAAVELIGFASTFNLSTDAREFAQTPAVVEFLRRDRDPFRVAIFPWRVDLPPSELAGSLAVSWALPFGIEDINGFNSLQHRRLVDVLVNVKVGDVTYGMLHPGRLRKPHNRALDALNVKYALLQKDYPWNFPDDWPRVYEDEFVSVVQNPTPTKRAFFAERVLPVPDGQTALSAMLSGGFDATLDAVVEDAGFDALSVMRAMGGNVELVNRFANRQTWRTRTALPRLLVVSEGFFPGWRAQFRKFGTRDDWSDLTIYRTNYLFRGVVAPPGDHELRFVYRPASVIVGTAVSALTVTLCAALLVRRRRINSAAMSSHE